MLTDRAAIEMAVTFEVRYESGELVDDDRGTVEAHDLPGIDGERFPHLRLVDPYGTTVFSQWQLEHGVILELEQWATEHPAPGVDSLVEMARSCVTQPRTALWLLGD